MALIELTDNIRTLIDSGNIVFSLFIDFSKAFDTVDHEILLYKLNHYGIRGHANILFKSYLTNRTQYTFANGINSSPDKVTCGVPQGSVLGPILFIIYANDIYRCAQNSMKRLFADDTCLSVHHKQITELINLAKIQIKNVIKWCQCNKLTINFDKTYFIIFWAKNKHIPQNINEIEIDGHVIKRVISTKYLGVYVDELLNWRDHVSYISKSLLKYFGIFNHIKHFVNKKIIRQLYFAFVFSRIKYGIEVFGSCSKEQLHRLQVLQSGLLKLLLHVDRRTDTNKLHLDLRILKVEHIYKMQLLMFVNNCRQKRCPTFFNSYFTMRMTRYILSNRSLENFSLAHKHWLLYCKKFRITYLEF